MNCRLHAVGQRAAFGKTESARSYILELLQAFQATCELRHSHRVTTEWLFPAMVLTERFVVLDTRRRFEFDRFRDHDLLNAAQDAIEGKGSRGKNSEKERELELENIILQGL